VIYLNVHVSTVLTVQYVASNFPKILLAYILGEVETFNTVLLSVSSWTCLPIFIEIGLHLTKTEQKISWHVYRHGVVSNALKM